MSASESPSASESASGDNIAEWWADKAAAEAKAYAAKAAEYGHADLDIMGQTLQILLGDKGVGLDPQELGIAFYLLGKVSRMFGAYAQGKLPSDDTLHDTLVYTTMMQRRRFELEAEREGDIASMDAHVAEREAALRTEALTAKYCPSCYFRLRLSDEGADFRWTCVNRLCIRVGISDREALLHRKGF